jgi:hypothetical protein
LLYIGWGEAGGETGFIKLKLLGVKIPRHEASLFFCGSTNFTT